MNRGRIKFVRVIFTNLSVILQVFEELTPEALDIIKPDILPVIQNYVASNVNETIHHLTMRDLVYILLGDYDIGDIAHLLMP